MKALPSDLNATYARILQNIPKSRWKKTVRLLHFLVYSQRPLTLEECVDVMAVRTDKRSFDPGDRLPNPTDITRFCPTLVVLTKTRKGWGGDWGGGFLQLAHFTVKEYLLHHDAEGFRSAEPSISITETCLFYLASVKAIEAMDLERLDSLFPLAEYAAQTWTAHARLAESSNDTVAVIVRFLQSEKQLRIWSRLVHHGQPICISRIPHKSGLYYACILGLTATVKMLLQNQSNVNSTSGVKNWTAIQGASEGGNQEIVQLLLDAGANVNTIGGEYGTALQAASAKGNKEIVQLLLDAGANVNTI
ncbi:ankyrin, partial [Colletotrichum caudatum]